MRPHRLRRFHRDSALAAALTAALLSGSAAAQSLPPTADPFDDDVSLETDVQNPDGTLPSLLGTVDGDPATVRLIRDGRVVAAGSLGASGGMETGALPAGVYSVSGAADGGGALFAYKITEGNVSADGVGPLPLVAPASDWPVSRQILASRFPSAAAGPTAGLPATPAGMPVGVTPPAPATGRLAPLTIRPIAATRTAAVKRATDVRPGDVGRIEQYDATGTLRPVPLAEVFLIRSGELISTQRADAEGLFTLPVTLGSGIHTLVSVGTAEGNALPGASVTGLNIAAAVDPNADVTDVVPDEPATPFRPVALRRVVKQGPAFSVAQAPGADVGLALGNGPPAGDDLLPSGLIGPGPAGGGFGGGAGGGGLAGAGGAGIGGGGLLIPALIGAGIGVAIAEGTEDDDDDDPPRGFGAGGTPPAASPARANAPPFRGGPPGLGNGNGNGNGNDNDSD